MSLLAPAMLIVFAGAMLPGFVSARTAAAPAPDADALFAAFTPDNDNELINPQKHDHEVSASVRQERPLPATPGIEGKYERANTGGANSPQKWRQYITRAHGAVQLQHGWQKPGTGQHEK